MFVVDELEAVLLSKHKHLMLDSVDDAKGLHDRLKAIANMGCLNMRLVRLENCSLPHV